MALADELEWMICNAPRAHCGGNTRCHCVVLREAVRELRKQQQQPRPPGFFARLAARFTKGT